MFMSRAQLRKEAIYNHDLSRLISSEYHVHQMVWDLCSDSPTRCRDFLYRYRDDLIMPSFFIVSSRELSDTRCMFHVETKPYSPIIRKGLYLQFSLRANPIRTKRDEKGRQHRHDVVMECKTRLNQRMVSNDKLPGLPEIVQMAGFTWLSTKGETSGFSIREGDVRVERYLSRKFIKPGKNRPVQFSTLDFNGMLTVTDEELFLNALYHGIGPAKGFGCGLMMVRPVWT